MRTRVEIDSEFEPLVRVPASEVPRVRTISERASSNMRAFAVDSSPREVTANNLYHCLNQFMYQALTDTNTITVDPTHKHLDITVGVITRNRAADLAEMLDSLTRQLRKPDEVLVVDNGSSDHTQAVVEGFRDRLPIRCQYLERADIPGARNLASSRARRMRLFRSSTTIV